jgi:hypothetical protein
MRIRHSALGASVAFCLATSVAAAPSDQILGATTNSCGEYLRDRAQSEHAGQVYAIEIRAYISGFNLGTSGKQTRMIPEAPAVLAWMDKYCRDHPLADMGQGEIALIYELGGVR